MDEQQKVRTITALAIAALAESATPYGIESFDSVLKPLWKGKFVYLANKLIVFCRKLNLLRSNLFSDVLLKSPKCWNFFQGEVLSYQESAIYDSSLSFFLPPSSYIRFLCF